MLALQNGRRQRKSAAGDSEKNCQSWDRIRCYNRSQITNSSPIIFLAFRFVSPSVGLPQQDRLGVDADAEQCVGPVAQVAPFMKPRLDRKSTRLNSSHTVISYA